MVNPDEFHIYPVVETDLLDAYDPRTASWSI